MFQIAVCDDEAMEATYVKKYIAGYSSVKRPTFDISIHTYTSSVELSEKLRFGRKYDLYILDILMPDISGIQLAQQIREKQDKAVIIFLTSSEDFFPQAFDVYALQYQVKPLNKDKFYEILDRAFSLLAREEQYFLFAAKTGDVKLPLSQITYAELSDRIVTVYLSDGRCEQSAYLRTSFETLMEPLLNSNDFLHPHKSFIVNMAYVRRLDSQFFELLSGEIIPISRKRISEIKKAYTDYLLKGAAPDFSSEQEGW